MKKLFILFAVATTVTLVACNNESATEKTEDSLTAVVDSSADAKTDSVEHKADSTANHIDSSASAMKDSIDKH